MVVVRPYDERAKGAIYNASLLLGGDGLDDVALDDRRLLGGLEGARRVLRRRGAFLRGRLPGHSSRPNTTAKMSR